MKLVLDTANLSKIEEYLEYLPVHGITTNPSIIKKEGKVNFINHIKSIKDILGNNKMLHVQVVSSDYNGILKDAYKILDEISSDIFIKIPVSKNGLKAIKKLKNNNVNITATAIYSKIQAYLAIELNCDYLAPYINRMMNLNTNPFELIRGSAKQIERSNKDSEIMGASFKNIKQVIEATDNGADFVTVPENILDKLLEDPNIGKAVHDFAVDWNSIFDSYSI